MHVFLNYYPDGKRDVFEKKNNYIKYSGNIKPYKISASRHSNHFKFKDAESLLNDFVNNFRSNFESSSQVIMEWGFLIENLQAVLVESCEPIVNIRYWSTDPYQTTFFNDYV